jgi:sugar/nucleoside kinase (ribokinase family)
LAAGGEAGRAEPRAAEPDPRAAGAGEAEADPRTAGAGEAEADSRAAGAGDARRREPGPGAAEPRAAGAREDGGREERGRDDVEDLARALHALGPENVVVTGGHRGEVTDVFFDGEQIYLLPGERHPDGAAHGSGCTHSSALAAHLALGFTPREAAQAARAIASEAVRDGHRSIGAGAGPVNVLGVAVRGRALGGLARRA